MPSRPLHHHLIRCNAIAPGTIDTPSMGDRINSAADPTQQRHDFIARQPMGRLGTAQEVANLVLFLASDESAFITYISTPSTAAC